MMRTETIHRLHAVIHGRVQGVGYRAFAARSAQVLELTGWVRNRYDGTVETIAEGERAKLEQFLRDLKRGPGPSNVIQIDEEWLPATGEFTRFNLRMTR